MTTRSGKPVLQFGAKVGDWTLERYRQGQYRSDGTRITSNAWLCVCTCGVRRWVCAANLRSGQSTSCGHKDMGLTAQYKSRNVRPANSVFDVGGLLSG